MGAIDLTKKRILVTGGNGYLGRHLTAALTRAGAVVYVMDKYGDDHTPRHFILDITDRKAVEDAVREIQPEIVFHLAASLNRERVFDRFDETNAINTGGTLNLLLALKEVDYEHFIFTGTSEVYGGNVAPFTENQLPDPASPYSLTKIYAELLIKTFSKTYGKKYTVLRLFNFFGKNMSPQFFIPQMIETFRKNETFNMTKGEQKRDFLYVDDVIKAMVLSARHGGKNDVFNVCSGKGVSLKELALEIKNTLGSTSEINFGALPYRENEVWNMTGDNTKIQREFGFVPEYDLRSGIKAVIEGGAKMINKT